MEEINEYISKNACKSICWRCAKGTNLYKCKWVKYCSFHNCVKELTREEIQALIPKGAELDNENYIIKCPNYESDGLIWTKEDKAKQLGVTLKEYINILNRQKTLQIRKQAKKLNMTIKDYKKLLNNKEQKNYE